MSFKNVVITGTGSYIPNRVVSNKDFVTNKFYDDNGEVFQASHDEIAEKFEAITGIRERRYVDTNQTNSEIGALAATKAIENAGIDKEDIDQIIVAHNFGDVKNNTIQTDAVPSLASRVKYSLQIKNPACIAYDVLFGCPGWLQGVIQAESFIRSGLAKKCLVVGTETLSRVTDDHDRDSMIYSDGAGACIVEAVEGEELRGILSSSMATYASEEAFFLYMGKSNITNSDPRINYLKMYGRKIYEFALKYVPSAMQNCFDKSGFEIGDLKKIFIHQANEKLDQEVTKRFYRLYKMREVPKDVMPMNIHTLGNSSVATIPTLFDQVRNKTLDKDHSLNDGDVILFASVGAGMNINAVTYKY
jgi:3-oxoacyl-[acyl-carrier-protein] synthase III